MRIVIDETNAVLSIFAVVGVFAIAITLIKALLERRIKRQFSDHSESELARWKAEHVASIEDAATARAQQALATWKEQNEAFMRSDAISRSRAVITGQITETIAPFLPAFPYNAKDAHFIGNPVDFIVFDGESDDFVERVIFLEVKAMKSSLTTRQRQIRDAIRAGRVEWQELRTSDLSPGLRSLP
jgi:predicted Holliday junction resolvase-like endonuclease